MGEHHSEMISSGREKPNPVGVGERLSLVMRGFALALPDHHGDASVRDGLPRAIDLGKRVEAGAHAGLCTPL